VQFKVIDPGGSTEKLREMTKTSMTTEGHPDWDVEAVARLKPGESVRLSTGHTVQRPEETKE